MSQFEGAVIREQGVTFAVIVVRSSVLQNTSQANKAVLSFQPFSWPAHRPDGPGRSRSPDLLRRRDISKFMSNVPVHAIPWRRYTVN